MDWYVIVLRIIHIFAGVFWVGAGATFVFFISPTAAATLPESQRFMTYLTQKLSFLNRVRDVAGLNVLAGLLLYWHDSGGLQIKWITTPTGIAFTIAGIVALIALLIVNFVAIPALKRLGALSGAIRAGGKPPSPEQAEMLQSAQHTLSLASRGGLALLAITLLGMATARYL
jgi:uncharacterized membrane protein